MPALLAGDIKENRHQENRMRDIHVGKRGSEAASEEQPDKLRKTVRLEQEAPNASASSDQYVALEYPASGETQSRPGSVLVQRSGHAEDDVQFLRWMHSLRWMDQRVVTSMPEISRSELNELVGNMTCLNALAGEMWKINPKIVTDEKSWKT